MLYGNTMDCAAYHVQAGALRADKAEQDQGDSPSLLIGNVLNIGCVRRKPTSPVTALFWLVVKPCHGYGLLDILALWSVRIILRDRTPWNSEIRISSYV